MLENEPQASAQVVKMSGSPRLMRHALSGMVGNQASDMSPKGAAC